MVEQRWEQITAELSAGLQDPGHPFRFATLATVGLGSLPRLRTVRIRDFDPEKMQLTFFTDSRSKKILHIKENNKVSLLFYHPDKLLQLRLEGIAIRERDPSVLKSFWKQIQGKSQLDYLTSSPPGTEIKNPDLVEYLDEEEPYFSVIYITPIKIEYLQLNRPNHLRIRFSKREGSWKSDFLVP